MPQTQSNWVGQLLDDNRYRVVAELGAGGMALVYLAEDQRLQTRVVIKTPRAELLQQNPLFATRFAHEIVSMVRLAHNHIVAVKDQGTHEGQPYVVLRYLEGGSLEDRIKQGWQRYPLMQRLRELGYWLPAIARTLDHIHAKHYIHRDIKPSNILFDAHGYVYLSDFGVAKALSTSEYGDGNLTTTTGQILGTPRYMASELILGQPLNGRVDQFSLAVSLYELLCGQPPFVGRSPMEILLAQNKGAHPVHYQQASLPPQVSEVLGRALGMNASDRFANCQQLVQTLFAALRAPAQVSPSPQNTAPGETAPPPGGRTITVAGPASPPLIQGEPARQRSPVEGITVPPPVKESPPDLVAQPISEPSEIRTKVSRFAWLVMVAMLGGVIFGLGLAVGHLWLPDWIRGKDAQIGKSKAVGTSEAKPEHPAKEQGEPALPRKFPEQLTVAPEGGDAHSLGEALARAGPNTRIIIRAGTYQEKRPLVVDRPWTIAGEGDRKDIQIHLSQPLKVTKPAKFTGLTFVGKLPTKDRSTLEHSAVILQGSSPSFEDCVFRCDQGSCLAIHGQGTLPVFRKCQVQKAGHSGVWVSDQAEPTLEDCIVESANQAACVMVTREAQPIFRRCQIRNGGNLGVLCQAAGRGLFLRCELSNHRRENLLIRTGANPVFRECQLHTGNDNIVAVEDFGKGTLDNCDIYNGCKRFANVYVASGADPHFLNCRVNKPLHRCILVTSQGRGKFEKCDISDGIANWASVRVTERSTPFFKTCEIHHGQGPLVWVDTEGSGVFDDCKIHHGGSTGANVVIRSRGNPIFRKCEITKPEYYGVYASAGGLGTFAECQITDGCARYAIVAITREANPVFRKCNLANAQQKLITVFGNGRGVFDDCTIHGGADKHAMVNITTGSQPIFKKCKIYDGKSFLVHIENKGLGTFERCSIHDGNRLLVFVTDNSQGTFDNCDIYNGLGEGYPNVGVSTGGNPTFRGCRIYQARNVCVWVKVNGLGTFVDCDLHDSKWEVVDLESGGNPTMRNCKIRNGKRDGILVEAQARGVFEGCTISNNTSDGVQIQQGAHVVLRDCTINSNTAAIRAFTGASALVTECDLRNNKNQMYISKSANIVQKNNKE